MEALLKQLETFLKSLKEFVKAYKESVYTKDSGVRFWRIKNAISLFRFNVEKSSRRKEFQRQKDGIAEKFNETLSLRSPERSGRRDKYASLVSRIDRLLNN